MLTPRESFKVAFLQRCAERGLTCEETRTLAKTAADCLAAAEKQAGDPLESVPVLGTAIGAGKAGLREAFSFAKWLAQTGTSLTLPLLLFGPAAAGTLAGTGLGAMRGEMNDQDVDELKLQDKIEAYRREAEQARFRNASLQRRRDQTRPSARPFV